MNKTIIKVPKGIKYISDWKEYFLPNFPCIIDKKLTGCGFTEFVIRGNFNTILISPRKILLENKEEQHNPFVVDEDGNKIFIDSSRNLYYAKCPDQELDFDKDITKKIGKISKEEKIVFDINKYYKDLEEAINQFIIQKKPIKILVTYDSFRKVREFLEKKDMLNSFWFIVDEFQSIFTDGTFKSGVELEFVDALQKIEKVCYISATPFIESALDKINEFKNLPYFEFDWESEDPGRIIHPDIFSKSTRNINETAKKIITEFQNKKYLIKTLFDSKGIPLKTVEAKELIFYVNSVKNICDIIRQNKLKPEEVNIICSNSKDNKTKLRKAFSDILKDVGTKIFKIPKMDSIIGKVPTKEEKNKPITLCTKTVYLGADFYSKCARTIILSDANLECLSVDIILDLPQIMGRQRDDENPWKYYAEIYYKTGNGKGDITEEQFNAHIQKKIDKTNSLLRSYDRALSEDKGNLTDVFEVVVKKCNYKENYIGISYHSASYKIPKINNIVMVAEERAFQIQRLDYKNRVSVFNCLEEVFGKDSVKKSAKILEIEENLETFNYFEEKMRRCCWYVNNDPSNIDFIPEPFKTYILSLGTDYILSKSGRKSYLDKALKNSDIKEKISSEKEIKEKIQKEFEEGKRYTNSFLKERLGELYKELGIPSKPKASDIEEWYEVKVVKITNSETKKRDFGFELIKRK